MSWDQPGEKRPVDNLGAKIRWNEDGSASHLSIVLPNPFEFASYLAIDITVPPDQVSNKDYAQLIAEEINLALRCADPNRGLAKWGQS